MFGAKLKRSLFFFADGHVDSVFLVDFLAEVSGCLGHLRLGELIEHGQLIQLVSLAKQFLGLQVQLDSQLFKLSLVSGSLVCDAFVESALLVFLVLDHVFFALHLFAHIVQSLVGFFLVFPYGVKLVEHGFH